MIVLGNHPEPTLPLTAPIVQALSACNGPAGVSIPTGQQGNATTQPDRNNTSSSNQALLGTADDLVIHANAEQDLKELTLDISGSHLVFDGVLVSRSHAKVGGSWNQFRHGFEYGQRSESGKPAFDLTGSDNCFQGPVPAGQAGDPAGTPDQVYRNAPPAVPAGFPQNQAFDPDGPGGLGDGNVLEHFQPGSVAANNAIAHTAAINLDFNGDGVIDFTSPAQPLGRYFVCGISPLPAGARLAPGCSGTGASAIMDRNVQGQVLEPGLYFVTGRAKLSASNLNAVITIVTGQQLNVNGSFQGQGFSVFRPYTDASGAFQGTLLFASQWDEAANLTGPSFPDGNESNDSPNTDKAEDALKIEGSLSRFEGIIVATNGRTEIAGEQLDFRCPVMGDRVRLNGSKNYFNSSGCVRQPNVTIEKTPDGIDGTIPDGVINAGELAVFKIVISNGAGAADASNVDIEDTLPGTGWTENPDTAECAITGGNVLHCDIATLAAGSSFTVIVQRATSTADCVGDTGAGVRLDNGSLDAGPTGDAVVEVNDIVADTDPGHLFVRCPDLEIEKTPDGVDGAIPDGVINAGDLAIFKIVVSNAVGVAPANNVDIEDTLPGTGWTENPDTTECAVTAAVSPATDDTLHCDIATIAAGASFTVFLQRATTTADCAGDTGAGVRLDNGSLQAGAAGDAVVEIDDTVVDTDPGHIIVKCPDAGVSKTPDDGTVDAGENIVFTITVTTNGPGPSPNVVLTDELPTGFLWTLGGANEAACVADATGDPETYQGGVTLTCNFGTIPFPGSRTITLTAPSSAANCGDTVENTAVITGSGDTVASNNSDPADVTVECGALMILKQSTKTGNPLVTQPGTLFSASGPSPAVSSFTVKDNNTPLPAGAKSDADTTIGEVCIENVAPGTYTITELAPPSGYGSGTAVDATAVVVSGTDCTANQPALGNRAVFRNPPLADIQVRFRDGGSTETFLDAAGITCDNVTGSSSTADTADWDDTLTVEDIKVTAATITVVCTIVIDP